MRNLKILFPLLLLLFLFAIIVIKAYTLPLTYDEYASTFYYPGFTVWQIIKYPDIWPSNHILNTLAVKFIFSLFGVSTFTARIPNIIAFLLYFGIVWSLANRYFRNSFLYFAVFVCLLCNPYLLDFFGLDRGYGISNALMITSIFFCLRFAGENKFKFLWLSFFSGMLASYANFTLLIYFAAINGVLIAETLLFLLAKKISRKQVRVSLLTILLFDAVYALLCYNPIHKMQSTNQFIYWSSNGIISDTVKSLISDSLYSIQHHFLTVNLVTTVCIILFILLLIISFIRIVKMRMAATTDPPVISFFILLFTLTANLLQTHLLKTPNLSGRTALSYFPLFMIPLLFGLRNVTLKLKLIQLLCALSITFFGLYYIAKATNMHSVLEWEFDQNTYQVINFLNSYRAENNLQTVDLNTSWWFRPSFSFYTETTSPWIKLAPDHHDVDTTSNTLFYYIMAEDEKKLQNEYRPVLSFDNGARMLLQHK